MLARRLLWLTLLGLPAFAADPAIPQAWLGTWNLKLEKSKITRLWGPEAPNLGTLQSQVLKIEVENGQLKMTGDSVIEYAGHPRHIPDSFLGKPDGKAVRLGDGIEVTLTKVDDWTFDILLRAQSRALGEQSSANHFVFSKDGKTLTETKHRREAGAPELNLDTVLVFEKAAP